MSELTIEELHQRVLRMGASHRLLTLPIIRALSLLGGRANKADFVFEVRKLVQGQISDADFQELRNRGRLGFTRIVLRDLGIIAPTRERGIWELTELGKRYAESRHSEPIVIEPFALAPRNEGEVESDVETERVVAHPETWFFVPILRLLSDAPATRSVLLAKVLASLKKYFAPGDFRSHTSGIVVWQARASWAVSNMKGQGLLESTGTGQWRVTDAGRRYLETEQTEWDVDAAKTPSSKALVARDSVQQPITNDATVSSTNIPHEIAALFDERVRPEAGASPTRAIRTKRNVVLYGPPGTGKTFIARALAEKLVGGRDESEHVRIVQFHPSYSYEDFIQGLRPDVTRTELRYTRAPGPFLQIAQTASEEPDAFFVLIIDEINRGDPARVFGELLYALEYRDEPVTLPDGSSLTVPPNLVIIGTMNSVDRSVALVDYALRRRFSFIRVDPDPNVIEALHPDTLLGEAGPKVLAEFNEWLTQQLDREHTLGHSYFLGAADPNDEHVFDKLWRLDVRPLLEEYFFDNAEALTRAKARWDELVVDAKANVDS